MPMFELMQAEGNVPTSSPRLISMGVFRVRYEARFGELSTSASRLEGGEVEVNVSWPDSQHEGTEQRIREKAVRTARRHWRAKGAKVGVVIEIERVRTVWFRRGGKRNGG